MPGSTVSGGGSQTSSGSRHARTRQYHKVAHTSQVDESLFGQHHSVVQRDQMLQEKRDRDAGVQANTGLEKQAAERSKKRSGGKNGKSKREMVQVVTKDLIRNLIVPEEDPSGQSIIMTGNEIMRIMGAARIQTAEEKRAALEKLKQQKEEELEAMHQRKAYMKQKDLQRRKNEKLNDLEEEERIKSEHLRHAAQAKLQEQEDEIKHLNELILNAKCHAIRDAQILEKEQMRDEMEHEERRLDQMMEVDRISAIKIEGEIEKKRKEERLLGAYKVMEQIGENEQEHMLELERKDQENRAMQKYLDKLCQEEGDKLERRAQEQKLLRDELNRCNSEILERRQLEKEQEKLLEVKVLEYQKEKAERDAEFEKEQELIRIEKEKEVARLRSEQERARDEQSERDALRAKRAQEQAEREWRKKEQGEVEKKSEMEAMLKGARADQMAMKEHFLAVQAQRERADFERVLKVQRELAEKEFREDDQRKHKSEKYADEVRTQIRQKEQARIEDRDHFFEEGVKLDEEARLRRLKLDDVKRKKLDELRQMGLPDRYIADIARKAKMTSPVST